jgi:prefoldin subunit 5
MPELISQAAETSDEFDTLIPVLTETSDIVEAFRLYHYGRPGQVTPPAQLSIHGHLNSLTESLQFIEGTASFLQEQYAPLSASAEFVETSINSLSSEYQSLTASASILSSSVVTLSSSVDVLSASVVNLESEIENVEYLQIKTVTDSLYVLEIDDVNKVIEMNSASANTVIVPNSASVNFPIGSAINIVRFSEEETGVSGDDGVTILSIDNRTNLTFQYSGATLYKYLDNTWLLIGNLA